MTSTNSAGPMTNAEQPVRADHAEHRAQREPTRTAQSLEENTMQIALALTVEVDATAWAEAYGVEAADLRADVLSYLRTHVEAATAPLSVIDAHHA